MWRGLHRWPAVGFGLLLIFLSLTGAILAVEPVLKQFDRYVVNVGDMTVGDLLRLTASAAPNFEVDRIRIDYSGRVMLRGSDGGGAREVPVNLQNGRLGRVERESAFFTLIRHLHRDLLLGETGKYLTLAGVLAMLGLLVSGLVLLTRRLGGVRKLGNRVRGKGLDKWHTVAGRLLVIPLVVTIVSGTWMALVSHKIVPSGVDHLPVAPETQNDTEAVRATDLAVFDQFRLADLTELSFPIAADWFDVYMLRQTNEFIFIDRANGAILSSAPVSIWVRMLDLFTLLHTGQGASVWGAVAGLAALSVPFFTITGVLVWWRRRLPRVRGLVAASQADVAVLVGSETGTTWGFGAHLAQRLTALGQRVHLGPMAGALSLRKDARLLVLAATYGDGTPPAAARDFLPQLQRVTGARDFAVLGFGDKSFPAYCAYAAACDAALGESGRNTLLPMGDVNRRSAQAFAAWGRDVGAALDLPLMLDYAPPRPKTASLTLFDRQDFGGGLGSPAAILRFRAKGLARFAAGDLLAVLPPADPVARLYSLASGKREGVVELCVARVDGGVCSTFLTNLALGACIDAYVEPNPDFRPALRKPTIMVGAGTGIAPFAGMIRDRKRGPVDLFFGTRHPDHDFYYGAEIESWRTDGRLDGFFPAFSRQGNGGYVQDRLREAATRVAGRLRAGGIVMVCGSRQMATAVAAEIDAIARTLGTSVSDLRQQDRYLEDIY